MRPPTLPGALEHDDVAVAQVPGSGESGDAAPDHDGVAYGLALAAGGVAGQVAESTRRPDSCVYLAGMASEEILQRRLTRARLALAALGVIVAVCVIAVGVTIWYWMSYLRGPSDTPFTRGPYLLRVSASEAALRWRVRGGQERRA